MQINFVKATFLICFITFHTDDRTKLKQQALSAGIGISTSSSGTTSTSNTASSGNANSSNVARSGGGAGQFCNVLITIFFF